VKPPPFFGDAAGAALLAERPLGRDAVPLEEILLGADGGAGRLVQVEWTAGGWPVLHLEGAALAGRALSGLAQVTRSLLERHGLILAQLEGIVAHGGNGRLPALLARQLGLPPERVWSETHATGNLGSASLPAAWVARHPTPTDPVAWVAVGAGLTWGAGLTGFSWDCLPSTAHR
jgi:3-oxoacyl-[acyl-carrier-protein] synthase III